MNLTEAELKDVLDILSSKLSHHMNRIELLRQERERKGRKIPTRDELELVNKVRNLQQHFHKLTNNKFNEGIEMNEYIEDLSEEELMELDKKTLASYIKKAHRSGEMSGIRYINSKENSPEEKKYLHKANQREKGINRAADKLVKEDIADLLDGIEMNEDINDTKYQQKKEKKLASLSKQIDDHVGRLGLATEKRKMKSGGAQHYQSNLEVRLHSKIDNLRQDHHRLKVGDIWPKKKSIWEEEEFNEYLEDLTEEELMELDKKTLASYIKKAAQDAIFKGMDAQHATSNDDKNATKKYSATFKRLRGVQQASDKLVKEDIADLLDNIESENYVDASNILNQIMAIKIDERIEEMKHGVNESVDLEDLSEEELMELDKKTLASYIKKAAIDQGDNGADIEYYRHQPGYHGEYNRSMKRLKKRNQGISRATDRLVKETD